MDLKKLLLDEVKGSFDFFYHFTNLDSGQQGFWING